MDKKLIETEVVEKKVIRIVRISDENIKVLSDEDEGMKIKIEFIDGKDYLLVHPGNRTHADWIKNAFKANTGEINATYLADQFFEHCVSPIGHNFRPTLDNLSPKKAGIWSVILSRFLEGKF